MISTFETILRLILSALVGGLIGMEREFNNRPAGLRTHILVCIGSTLIMLVSIYGFNDLADPSRLAAGVVSGIGFLGAGTILRTGSNIEGLTTAASLWICAGIGLAIGAGFYLESIFTAALVLFSLTSLGKLDRFILRRSSRNFLIVGEDKEDLVEKITNLFDRNRIIIKTIGMEELVDESLSENILTNLRKTVGLPKNLNMDMVIYDIYELEGVKKVYFNGTYMDLK